jgi:hypothetical protein
MDEMSYENFLKFLEQFKNTNSNISPYTKIRFTSADGELIPSLTPPHFAEGNYVIVTLEPPHK